MVGEHGRIGLFSGRDFRRTLVSLLSLVSVPMLTVYEQHCTTPTCWRSSQRLWKYDTSTAVRSCKLFPETISAVFSPIVHLRTLPPPPTSHHRRRTGINSNHSRIGDDILGRTRGVRSFSWMVRGCVVYVSHRHHRHRVSRREDGRILGFVHLSIFVFLFSFNIHLLF